MKQRRTSTNTPAKPLMRNAVVAFLTALLLSIFSGCGKGTTSSSTSRSPVNACELIQKDEVERVVGSPIKDAQSSVHPDRGFVTSDCLYTAAEFSKSVSFSVTQRIPESAEARTPKDFWKKTFGRYDGEEEEREAEEHASKEERTHEHEEEESPPPRKINGVGDEAFWMKSGLYVLQKDVFIRVSVGGAGNEESKIEKSKALAAVALKRL
jgi:hypothetical protein